jgi:hypothetical protein
VKAKSVDMAQQLAVKRLNQQYARGIRLTALAIIATFGTNSQQPATASRILLAFQSPDVRLHIVARNHPEHAVVNHEAGGVARFPWRVGQFLPFDTVR